MLSLSVSCIHLELSAAKSPKEQSAPRPVDDSFSGRQKNDLTVHNANGTRLRFCVVPIAFRAGLPGFRQRRHAANPTAYPDDRARLDVAIGSFASISACPPDVRFGGNLGIAGCPVWLACCCQIGANTPCCRRQRAAAVLPHHDHALPSITAPSSARSLIQIKACGEIGKIELPSVPHDFFRP